MEATCTDEVSTALAEGRAVVALESTIFSNLGLPSPANAEALDRCLAAIRAGGAVPAIRTTFRAPRRRIIGTARSIAHHRFQL